jgi:mono/diheme cytochrome c family protein
VSANRGAPRGAFLLILLSGMLLIAGISMPLGAGANGTLKPASKEAASTAQDQSGADLKRGRRLFIRDCAHCHGKNGDGSSPVRRTLHPAPLDLTGFNLTESYILNVLHDGVPGSDMPAWHSSPEKDLRAVSAYTTRLGRPDQLSEQDRYAPPDALQEAGRRIYAIHCARCHGQSGNGDGSDAARYRPSPPSFRGMRPSYTTAKRLIESGVPGTAMPSWPLLTPSEIQAVTYYIRSLYARGRMEASGVSGATR